MTETTVPAAPLARLIADRPALLRVPVVLAGVAALALASQVGISLGPVPLTLQTYALFVIAGLGGMRLSFEVVLVWLLSAIVGLPVLAAGASGPEALMGPTAGFLLGMLIAAPLAGRAAERGAGWLRLAVVFLLGHGLILALGWIWLSTLAGPGEAFLKGVAPFAPGAILKSIAAALTVTLATWKSR